MKLVTGESVFNSLFETKEVTFESLFRTAIQNNYMTKLDANNFMELYENSIIKYIMANNEVNEDINVNILIKRETERITRAINEYAKSLTPYEALNMIISTDPMIIIDESIKLYSEKQKELSGRICVLNSKMANIRKYCFLINDTLEFLEKSITKKTDYSLYRTMCGGDIYEVDSLAKLSKLYDLIEIEFGILRKFDEREVIRLLTCGNPVLDSKNVVEACLYNYVFNYFYKEKATLTITEEMVGIVARDIKMGLFDVSDATDVIESGPIEFANEEKEYIYKYFIKTYENEVIKTRRIDCVIKN